MAASPADCQRSTYRPVEHGRIPQDNKLHGDSQSGGVSRRGGLLTRAWIAAIRDGTRVKPDFDDGAAVQRIIAACARSAAEGRRVSVAG